MSRKAPDAVFLSCGLILCFSRFRFGLAPLAMYDDDFFYYLRAALNFADTGRSTFDGIHLTNGYHPLWFLLVTGLIKAVRPAWFFVALQTAEFVLAVATFFLLRRLFRAGSSNILLADCTACFVSALATMLVRGGMEIALLFPLVAASLAYRLRHGFSWSTRQSAIFGLLLSLVILSRLDSILLVLLWLMAEYTLRSRPGRNRFSSMACFAAGGSLLPLYLLSNRLWFHVWMPVSGQAKQLRTHHWPALRVFRSTFLTPSISLQIIVVTAMCLTLLCVLRSRSYAVAQDRRRIALAMLCFPFVHLLVFSVLSDWDVWPWYFYPFVLSDVASGLLLLSQIRTPQPGRLQWLCWSALASSLLLALAVARPSSAAKHALQENLVLATYMRQHPGTYAMGDQSGMLSYLSDSPIVQTEGLMEDATFLSLMRQQLPLAEVLRRYGATYYITGEAVHSPVCFTVQEPAQAGPDSPHLHGRVCDRDALFQGDMPLHQIYLASAVRQDSKTR